ncbi:hypothetical protein [Algoriphagus sp.]|uniref:hypothetical protein n=1 Tax=Algoriphagus sp. TaxID=1872435 RepID=UPI0025D4B95C|nr:hypothetical protein [Algoriphagus sp.]
MLIQTINGDFLIERNLSKSDCVKIKTNSKEELQRLFGSCEIVQTTDSEFPFEVCTCKQEFANALILMVKEIEYPDFKQLNFID